MHIADAREDPITGVPSVLSSFVPDSLRELVMADSTIITAGRNLSGQRLVKREFDMRDGAYLTTGRKPAVREALPLRVGVLWRSHVVKGFRGITYLSFEDIAQTLEVTGVEFVCLQHKIDNEERSKLRAHGVTIPKIDLFNDFDGMAELISTLDLVIGVSTFPIEFAAALGVPVWMLGFNPENFHMRTLGGQRRKDVMTANSTIVAPDVPRFWLPRAVSVNDTMHVVKRDLRALVRERS
jgi:hypothetical protein